jgi:hypothetical protein
MLVKTTDELSAIFRNTESFYLENIFSLSVGDDVLGDDDESNELYHGCSNSLLFLCSHSLSEVLEGYNKAAKYYNIDLQSECKVSTGLSATFILRFSELFSVKVSSELLTAEIADFCEPSTYAELYLQIASLCLSGLDWKRLDIVEQSIGGSALMSPCVIF